MRFNHLDHISVKYCFIFFISCCFLNGYAQDEFNLETTGLVPAAINIRYANQSATDLYEKALRWIEHEHVDMDLELIETDPEKTIIIQSLSENAVKVGKQSFHIKFVIALRFENGSLMLEPISLSSKLNSKYDMGWKEIDLKNTGHLFKKNKPIKKTKDYVSAVPKLLNALSSHLREYLAAP